MKPGPEHREVTMSIDGTELQLNGFVQDVTQEVILALVRALGDVDEDGEVIVRVGATRRSTSPEREP